MVKRLRPSVLVGYSDYATYIKTKGLKYAKERRRLYRIRHDGEQKKVGSAGFYSFLYFVVNYYLNKSASLCLALPPITTAVDSSIPPLLRT